ncbi:MAG: hypothetical protein ACI93R_001917 [Flavobacteriales bacterium]|jgi:hypothetical protein
MLKFKTLFFISLVLTASTAYKGHCAQSANASLTTTVTSTKTATTLDAAAVMKLNDERYTGDTQITESVLTLIDKKGRKRIRNLKLFGIETDEVEKSTIYFLSPADVKGTAYMSFDWQNEDKEDDSWLYLPALQDVRRVAASDESGAFMGSDFSYADINGTDYEDFNYTMLNENDPVDGVDCWLIQSIPKNDSVIDETGYLASKSWIRKDNYLQVKAEIQVKKGKKVKYFVAKNIEKIQGVWTAKTLQMITTRNGKKTHASVLQINTIQYNEAVDESLFDTQAMQRGL